MADCRTYVATLVRLIADRKAAKPRSGQIAKGGEESQGGEAEGAATDQRGQSVAAQRDRHQPDQPRPKPGTPEYDAMVKAALAQRGISTGPLPQRTETTPSYQAPQQPQTQPAWQPEQGQPRPKPGTPEYDAMVKAALAQRGISTNPPPSQPSSQGTQTSSFDPTRPRPKPGTPEYDEMVRAALNERRQREGR